jgi:hypothetical protein
LRSNCPLILILSMHLPAYLEWEDVLIQVAANFVLGIQAYVK